MVPTLEVDARNQTRAPDDHVPGATTPVRVALCSAGEIWGGVEQFLLTLAPGLKTAGVEPLVILFHDGLLAERLRSCGVRVEALDRYGRYDPRSVWALRRLLRQCAIDILHVHGYKATLLGGIAARSLGIKVVKTEHGRLEPPATWRSWRAVWSHCKLSANVVLDRVASRHLVDAFTFVSRDTQARGGRYPKSVPQHVIYNGIEPLVPGARTEPRASEYFNVAIVGRITKVKGHDALLAAMDRLRHLGDIRLHVFGTGPLEAECRRWCEQEGLSDRVIFHGFQAAIHDHIAGLDVLAIPSLDEGLPYVLLEAMYLQVPVIASRVGGLHEVLSEHDCGLLVPPRDPASLAAAIALLYRSRELRGRLAQRAYAAVCANFLAPAMVARYAELYRGQRRA